jgi:thymidylate kinase
MREQIDSYVRPSDVTGKDTAPTTSSAEGHSLSHFLRLLFRLLDEHETRYCVLHSWQGLPDELPSDLDLAVHPRDRAKLASVFQGLLNEGYRPVQHYHHGTGHRFDFVWFEAQGMRFASIDLNAEYYEGGLILMRGEDLVLGRRRVNGFWTADPAVEFAYLLVKKTLKGSLPCRQAERLKVLVDEIGSVQAQKIAGDLFGKRWKERVVEACKGGSLSGLLPVLKKRLWFTRLTKYPLTPLRHLLREVPRLVGRSLRPIGLFVVILGPDGVGKSTLVGRLAESLERAAFSGFHIYHWRPMVIAPKKESGVPVADPHDEPLRGTLGSIVALFGVLLDYWLGFAFVLRPFLVRSGLIVFDRYYHDLLIDPIRYRYGGPMWLAKFLGRFIPPPDLLFLVLDAGDEVILSRKREVPPEELRRQREGYRQFRLGAKRATLVNTDRGIEPTLGEAIQFIVEFLTQRFQRRHARWLACKPTSSEGNRAAGG